MKQVKSIVQLVVAGMSVLGMLGLFSATAYAAGIYVHDPMANGGAAKDIVVDAKAVYGYAPSPDSSRLKEYVSYDWSDPVLVARLRQEHEAYHESMKELYSMIAVMKTAGASVEDMARAVSTRRNELRLEGYKDDAEGLARAKASNLENYGNENGGTPEYFYNKYGSWETVIEKALSSNPGMDACLGLYDKYYDTYLITPAETQTETIAAASNDYTVISGDNLSKIAEKFFGDTKKWRIIYDMNADRIRDPNLIYSGQVLKIQ